MRALSDTWTMAKRSLRHTTRSLDTITTVVLMPFAMLLLFVYVFGGALGTQTGAIDYIDYITPGVIIMTVASGIAYVSGAIIGDLVGYRLGRTLGPSLLDRKRMARVARHLDKSVALLSERGWWALVVARFASVLRAIVPFAAGMGRMPYRRFLLGNAVGGVAWCTAFTLVGYLAGANYPRVEGWFRTGGLAVAGLVVLVAGIVWLTRWVQHNQAAVVRALHRVAVICPIRLLTDALHQSPLSGVALAVAAAGIVGGV